MVVNSLIIPEWRNKMIIVSYKGRCLLDCTIRTDKKKPYKILRIKTKRTLMLGNSYWTNYKKTTQRLIFWKSQNPVDQTDEGGPVFADRNAR